MLRQELMDQRIVYPPLSESCFRAFKECSFTDLRVVMLSQAPYSNGLANGLCYDVQREYKPEGALQRILYKINEEYPEETSPLSDSYLGHLPAQGVLMLNMALSCRRGNPKAHVGLWAPFFSLLMQAICQKNYIAWLQWGMAAQIDVHNTTHFIVRGDHPSPFAGKGFMEGIYFKKVNNFLERSSFNKITF